MTIPSRPLLLGHRGARATRSTPENSLASFDLCLQHGCDGFEFDVRATAEGSLVVCHDAEFRGSSIAAISAQELHHWQAQGFLPSLKEVLRRFSSKCFLDIELKTDGLETEVVSLLRQHKPHDYVITSFLPEALRSLRELDSKLQLGYLFDESLCGSEACSAGAAWRDLPVQWVLPEWHLLDEPLALSLRDAGKRIGAWTVNETADMHHLAALGVELLISDETARLVNTFRVS